MPSPLSEQSDPEPPSIEAGLGLRIDIIAGPNWPSSLEPVIQNAVKLAFSKAATEILDDIPPLLWDVAIALTGDAEIQTLNREWRDKDKPTNVLSFPSGALDAIEDTVHSSATQNPIHLDGMEHSLGDIALAWETVTREAEEEGKTLEDHAQHLAVHGLLHILGFDHETMEEAEEMEALEVEILAELGVSNPYRHEEVA